MIDLPDFFNNPSLISFGEFKIQYYSLTWIASALLIYFFLKNHRNIRDLGLNQKMVSDMVIIYGLFFGAMIGGRLGYMFFYDLQRWIEDPFRLFFLWQGGLSFHGGLIGVILSLYVFSIKQKISFLALMDSIALAMPIGLGLVRIGNFLNGELFGRPTNGEWGFIFPTDPLGIPRHPSQLYECFLEGIILFFVLNYIARQNVAKGVTASALLIFYGLFRFIVEFFRQPDMHIGLIAFDLSMGQILSLPMMIIGLVLVVVFQRNNATIS